MRSAFLYSTLLFLIICSSFSLRAQQELKINFDESERSLSTKYKYNNKPKDSIQAVKFLNELVQKFHADGYLLATYSDLTFTNLLSANISIGPRFEWLSLNLSAIDKQLLRRAGLRFKNFSGKPVSPELLIKLEKGLLELAENEGFPFAKLKYDSLAIRQNQIRAKAIFDFGPEIIFDSVKVENNRPIKSKFISAYLGVRKGQPYKQELIDAAVRKLSRLTYVKLVKDPELIFSNNDGQLSLNLKIGR